MLTKTTHESACVVGPVVLSVCMTCSTNQELVTCTGSFRIRKITQQSQQRTNLASVFTADVAPEPDRELLTVFDEYLMTGRRSHAVAVLRQPLDGPVHLGRRQQLKRDVSTAGSQLAVGVSQHSADDSSLEAEFQLTRCGFGRCMW